MKAEFTKLFLSHAILMAVCLFGFNNIKAQINDNEKQYDIRNFKVIIVSSDYAMAYSIQILLTDKQIKVFFKSGLEGGKDTILFSKILHPSDTLQQISIININSLKKYYSNPCIEDGSQITVLIQKDNQTKSVHLSNYYQEDVGKIIYLVNSLVPENYKVWYNKERLIADYKKCQGLK